MQQLLSIFDSLLSSVVSGDVIKLLIAQINGRGFSSDAATQHEVVKEAVL